MHIIPVASGKGGVGKSLVSANLAIALARAGQRVVLADLDLGGSNLHLILGLRTSGPSIGEFLSASRKDFSQALMETGIDGLTFVPGDAEIPGLANLTASQKNMLLRRLTALDTDYLILDLGAGTGQNTLDFFLSSRRGIIVTTPTPTATVNAYLFLKNVVFRLLRGSVKRGSKGARLLDGLFRDRSADQRAYLPDIVRDLEMVDSAAAQQFRTAIRRFQPRLILNMVEDPKDAETVQRLRRSTQQYLDVDLLHLGVIYRDDLQNTALSARLPILRYKPNSILSQAIVRIGEKIVQLSDEDEEGFADLDMVNDSFDAAEAEAEADFDDKLNYIEDLLQAGALSTGDLVETVKSQQHELTRLRRQNDLYKSKLVKAIQQGFKP